MSCGQNATHEIFWQDSVRNHVFMVALTLYLDAYNKKPIRNRSRIKKIIEKNAVRSCPQKRTTLIVALGI